MATKKIEKLSDLQAADAAKIERAYNYERLTNARDAHMSALPILQRNIDKHTESLKVLSELLTLIEQLPGELQAQSEGGGGGSRFGGRTHVHDVRQHSRILYGTAKARAAADLQRAQEQLDLAHSNLVGLEASIREMEAAA